MKATIKICKAKNGENKITIALLGDGYTESQHDTTTEDNGI